MGARTTVRAAAAVAVAAALLIACGSDGAGSPAITDQVTTTVQASVGGRACAMSSLEEVGNAIGVLPVASVEHDADGMLTCSFNDATKVEMASIVIMTIESDPPPAVAFARLAADDAEGNELIEGFGDEAVWASNALHVSIGGEVVTFTILPQETLENSEAVRSATLDLATLALPRYAPAPPDSVAPTG